MLEPVVGIPQFHFEWPRVANRTLTAFGRLRGRFNWRTTQSNPNLTESLRPEAGRQTVARNHMSGRSLLKKTIFHPFGPRDESGGTFPSAPHSVRLRRSTSEGNHRLGRGCRRNLAFRASFHMNALLGAYYFVAVTRPVSGACNPHSLVVPLVAEEIFPKRFVMLR
jgi:hypothetical protein